MGVWESEWRLSGMSFCAHLKDTKAVFSKYTLSTKFRIWKKIYLSKQEFQTPVVVAASFSFIYSIFLVCYNNSI